jgi:cyclase
LLLRGAGLVKTTRFKKPSYVGDPINVVRIFNEKEVDELVLCDVAASKEGKAPSLELLERIASEAFMPVCYAGGVRTVEQARAVLKLGVEKIGLNSALLEDPSLASRLADAFGSQCVVGCIDVRRNVLGRYVVHSHARAPVREKDPVRWARALVERGAGEILVQSVDRDGTLSGYDVELLAMFDDLRVPVIGCGGAASVEDIVSTARATRLSALGVGARFVYYGPHRAVLVTYLDRGELQRVQDAAR